MATSTNKEQLDSSREKNKPAQLLPSELGTKAYWDTLYTRELTNHTTDPTDEGTIWFSDSNAEDKMLETLASLKLNGPTRAPSISNLEDPDIKILDLGTGNGHLLFALKDEGWQAHMVGLDYSEKSIELARRVQEARVAREALENGEGGEDDDAGSMLASAKDVKFFQWDILSSESPTELHSNSFDIIIDKGTFDAVSLMGEDGEQSKERNMAGIETYVRRVRTLLHPGGHFLIVSCNWTESELRSWFEGEGLFYHESVAFPRFKFGGIEGQSVSGLCLKMKSNDT